MDAGKAQVTPKAAASGMQGVYLAVSASWSQRVSPKSGLPMFAKGLFPAAPSQGHSVCRVRDVRNESPRLCCSDFEAHQAPLPGSRRLARVQAVPAPREHH